MRRTAVGLGRILLLVAIFAVATELTLRVATRFVMLYDVEMSRYAFEVKQASPDPRIGHVHRPSVETRLMGVEVSINEDGLRDRAYPLERGPARRIAVLGDSLTFGWGVPQDRTFEALLEARLAAERPTEVLNFGVGNYNTEQSVRAFLARGARYRPDAVVLFYFINDAEPTPRRSRWAPLARSRAVAFYASRLRMLRSRFDAEAGHRAYYASLYADDAPGWKRSRRAFQELHDWAAEHGAGALVVLLPELHQLRPYPFAEQHARVLRALAGIGLAAVDLAPAFADVEDPRRLWVARDDAHPNAEAHARIAEAVLPLLAPAHAALE